MEPKGRKVLTPDYLKKFNCIGSTCEDCCCMGTWRVFVDKATFLKYRHLPPGSMKELLEKNISRNRQNSTDENYARVKFGNNNQCPFLNEERLCLIQLNLGEAYLGKVCRTYPRYTNIVGGKIEKVASVSCPEAARIVLLNEDGIRFSETVENADAPLIPNYQLSMTDLQSARGKYFFEMRALTVDVLQAREYELWQRLMILGLFYQSVQRCYDEGTTTEIPAIVEKYRNMVATGAFQGAFGEIPSVATVQRKILKQLVDERLVSDRIESRYVDCLKEVFLGLGFVRKSTEEQLEAAYQIAYEENFQPFMKQYGYIMENYLVNYVFKNLFPLGGETRLFDNYVIMILHYSLLKIHLLGTLRFHGKTLNAEHIIKLIQSFAKVVEHNPPYVKRTFQLMQDNQMNNLSYMAILIKN